jgi:hypothetical protein
MKYMSWAASYEELLILSLQILWKDMEESDTNLILFGF